MATNLPAACTKAVGRIWREGDLLGDVTASKTHTGRNEVHWPLNVRGRLCNLDRRGDVFNLRPWKRCRHQRQGWHWRQARYCAVALRQSPRPDPSGPLESRPTKGRTLNNQSTVQVRICHAETRAPTKHEPYYRAALSLSIIIGTHAANSPRPSSNYE